MLGSQLSGRRLVLYDMLRRLDHHSALCVEAGPAGAPGDLVKLPGVELAHPGPVIFGQPGQQHRADGHIDAHPQRVRAGDDLQQSLLSQLLHQPTVLRQHAGVMDPDAGLQQPRKRLAVAFGESEGLQLLTQQLALILGEQLQAHQPRSTLCGGPLGEVDHIDRGLLGLGQLFERVHQGRGGVAVAQRHGANGRGDDDDVAPGPVRDLALEGGCVAQGGRHQQELRLRKLNQRHLPGPAPVRIGVEMELIHHHRTHIGGGTVAQRLIGQDLSCAADDGRLSVDRRIPGDHPHIRCAEDLHQREELLGDQGFDGRGVDAALTAGQGEEVRRQCHQGLPRAGGGGHDHMVAVGQLQDRVLLCRVERQSAGLHPGVERLEQLFRAQRTRRRSLGNLQLVGGGRRRRAHQPRSRHWLSCGRSSPSVVGAPWPG